MRIRRLAKIIGPAVGRISLASVPIAVIIGGGKSLLLRIVVRRFQF
jgi:hypothetical protein